MDIIQPFLIGMISGCSATMVVQPIDMIKVRLQLKNEELGVLKSQMANLKGKQEITKNSFGPMVKTIYSESGVLGFYKGLSSALMRQVFYATTKLGLYKVMTDKHKAAYNHVSFWYKIFYGLSSGIIGSFIGNPADLALVRIQADNLLPPAQRRNYTGFWNATFRTINEEGFTTLFRGSTPTIARGAVINVVMLVTYDEVKERLNKLSEKKDSLLIRITAAPLSGTLGAFMALPFDNAKTKIQKMKPDAAGLMPYKNIFDCMWKTIVREGAFGLWIGMSTFYFRCAGHISIVLLVQDFTTQFFNKVRGKH